MAGKGTAFQERFKKKKKVSCSAWSISASYCFIFSFALLREQRKKKNHYAAQNAFFLLKSCLGWPVFPLRVVKTSFKQKEYRQG